MVLFSLSESFHSKHLSSLLLVFRQPNLSLNESAENNELQIFFNFLCRACGNFSSFKNNNNYQTHGLPELG